MITIRSRACVLQSNAQQGFLKAQQAHKHRVDAHKQDAEPAHTVLKYQDNR